MAYNLPPGCSESDIPGNRPEDAEWDELLNDIIQSPFTAKEARARWESQPGLLATLKNALVRLHAPVMTKEARLMFARDVRAAIATAEDA